MSMFSDDELARARADLETTLPGTAVIMSASVSVDAYGSSQETWSASGTVACRIDPFNRQDSSGVIADQEQSRSWYRLTVPTSATIASNDRVIVAGATYDIVQLHNQHSERLVTRALLSLVRVE